MPTITLVAKATKSWLSVLETKGKDRETRRLHSMTLSWLSWNQEEEELNHITPHVQQPPPNKAKHYRPESDNLGQNSLH